MLRVWFGDRDNVIYNTSVYFRNRYKDSWIIDSFARAAIKDIDRSEVLDANTIQSPVLGQIPPDKLSGGVTIAIYHIMDFVNEDFEIRILNDKKLIVHNMREFLDAADKYLRENMQ